MSESTEVRKHVPDDVFINTWESSTSRGEVAERLGLKKASVTLRANKLRKLGVPLQDMARASNARKRDIAALAALCKASKQ